MWAGPISDDAELRCSALLPLAIRAVSDVAEPMNLVGDDSDISDDENDVSLISPATLKKEGYVDPKRRFTSPVRESGIFLGKTSKEVVTSLAEEEDINTSDEDSLLGSYSVTGRVEKSLAVSTFESGRQDEDAIWYEVNQEAEELFQSTICAPNRYTRKASIGKRRSSVSLHSHPFCKEKSCLVRECGGSSDHEELDSDGEISEGQKNPEDRRNIKNSVAAALESCQQVKKIRPDISESSVNIIPLRCSFAEHSAVELLDNLQSKSVLLEEDPTKKLIQYAGYKRRHILSETRSSHTLGDRSLNNEDPSEPICSSPSSDDDESEPSLMIVAAEATEKTMADRFLEAVGTSILNDQEIQYAFSKPLGLGLSGKLQQVMRDEKDNDARFLMIQHSIEQSHDNSSFLDVKILSRYLEGKLVVCRCSVTDQREGIHKLDISKTVLENNYVERVFIFSFRTCNDVDLDVENSVRIHGPWKEVDTARHGIVTLCSYFSQMKFDEC